MSSGSISPARAIACDAFVNIHTKQMSAEAAFAQELEKRSCGEKDVRLAFEILYGSLRWQSKIYWILQNISSRNLDEVNPVVQAALVLGTYQIFYLDRVPDRAAVNEAVEYVKSKGFKKAAPFVNGIMRQVARKSQYFPKPDKVNQQIAYLAIQFAHPEWMVARWVERFTKERVEQILSSNNYPPPWSVRLNPKMTEFEQAHLFQKEILRQEGIKSDRRPLRCCIRLKGAPILRTEDCLFQTGFFTIQDEAAQLISYIVEPKPEDKILDMCVGPGGKASHILELCPEAQVLGTDIQKSQLDRCASTSKRLGLEFPTKQVDYLENTEILGEFTKVLLDAPCSGLGVLRRYPEGKHFKSPNVVSEMATLQRQLLKKGWDQLQPGGELIYSVCSFEVEEGEDQMEWCKSNLECEVVSFQSRLPDYYRRYVTKKELLLIYSGNPDQMDGFTAFVLRKPG